jgi:hypothetical protein
MTLPTFLVIGAMKAGTTSLWSALREHPAVFMPDEKELDFFVAEKRWPLGVDWYRSQFAAAPASAAAIGEASTNYSKHPLFAGVPARAASVLPDVKLVYLLRHPVERMRSHWRHARSAGWETRTFARAIEHDPQYLDVSRYAHQLEQWLAVVGRDRVLVETSERLRDDPADVMAGVHRFLGVGEAPSAVGVRRVHAADELAPPRRALARSLRTLPGSSTLARLVPERVRRAYGRATTITLDPRATSLDPAHESEVVDRLRPDLVRLRELVGGGFDAWGLA